MLMNFGSVPKLCGLGIVTEDSSGTLITSEYDVLLWVWCSIVGMAQIKHKICHVNWKQ